MKPLTPEQRKAALEAFAREHIIHMDYVETMYANIHDKNWDKDSQRLADWLSAWQAALESNAEKDKYLNCPECGWPGNPSIEPPTSKPGEEG